RKIGVLRHRLDRPPLKIGQSLRQRGQGDAGNRRSKNKSLRHDTRLPEIRFAGTLDGKGSACEPPALQSGILSRGDRPKDGGGGGHTLGGGCSPLPPLNGEGSKAW